MPMLDVHCSRTVQQHWSSPIEFITQFNNGLCYKSQPGVCSHLMRRPEEALTFKRATLLLLNWTAK